MYNWLYVGRTPAELADRAHQLMNDQHHRTRVFGGVRKAVAALRAKGFQVRVISAGVHEFVQAGAVDVGFAPSEVQGLALEVRDGLLTDRVVEPIPYQQGKAALATTMCGGRPMYAFGDSVATGDASMLRLAAVPVAVKPHERHLAAACDQHMLIWQSPEE